MLALNDKEYEFHQLGYISNIGFGLRDIDSPCVFFNINTLSGGSLQVLVGKDIDKFIRLSGVYDIKSLENRHIVVKSKNGFQSFVGFH